MTSKGTTLVTSRAMPGYNPLFGQLGEAVAEYIRCAKVFQRVGDPEGAARLLEAEQDGEGSAAEFSAATIDALHLGLAATGSREESREALVQAVAGACIEARERGYAAERLVVFLKQSWRVARPATVDVTSWERVYQVILTTALALFFADRVA